MIKIEFVANFNQKKRRAFLFREVKKVEKFDEKIYREEAISYKIHMDGIKKDYIFEHPILCLAFLHPFIINPVDVMEKMFLHDIAILGISRLFYHKQIITHMDLAQLLNYEDNLTQMINEDEKATAEKVNEYWAEIEAEKQKNQLKNFNSEDIKELKKEME